MSDLAWGGAGALFLPLHSGDAPPVPQESSRIGSKAAVPTRWGRVDGTGYKGGAEGRGPTGRGGISAPMLSLPQTSLTPNPHISPGLQMPSWRSHGFPVSGTGMLSSGRGPHVNQVALFTLDTLYTALQSAGEIKASEMVYDATW